MNVYVSVVACAWPPRECSYSRLPCSTRRALCSQCFWPTLSSVESRMTAFRSGFRFVFLSVLRSVLRRTLALRRVNP